MKQITRKLIEVGLAAIFFCSPLVAATTNNVAAATIRKANSKKKVKTRAVAKSKKAKFGKKGVSSPEGTQLDDETADNYDWKAEWDTKDRWLTYTSKGWTFESDRQHYWNRAHIYTTVTFDAGIGTDGPYLIEKVDYGDKAWRPDDPVKPGYIFEGWFCKHVTYDFNSIATDDITLIAHWIPEP